MSTPIRQDARSEPPQMPGGELLLQPPPEIEPSEGGGALMNALPMLGSLGSIAFIASTGGTRGLIAGGMFLVATLGFVAVSIWRQHAQRGARTSGARREYLRYLAQTRGRIREAAARQRQAAAWANPDPAALPAVVAEGSRVWERTAEHPDHLRVRIGLSPQPLAMRLVPPETAPIDQLDPVAASALHRLLVTHHVQPDLPTAVDLTSFARLEIAGEPGPARALTRAVICSAAAFHGPDDLVVAVVADPSVTAEWEWLKWLPHAGSPVVRDAAGPARMVAADLRELEPLLPPGMAERARFRNGVRHPEGPHVVVVVDGGVVPVANDVVTPDGVAGVTVIDLPATWDELTEPDVLRLQLDPTARADGRVPATAVRSTGEVARLWADQPGPAAAEALARRLSPRTVAGPVTDADGAVSNEFTDLMGLPDPLDMRPVDLWRPRPPRDRLRVPVGIDPAGAPVHLDIKQTAMGGMGPHGLVVGATGSGKSEFLRTLVLGLAVSAPPEELNFVLVDFKGGATFVEMADLPHVSAVITNLQAELPLVDRMQDVVAGELDRRQELLRASGNHKSAADYERARAGGAPLEPLPSLLIVVDEFTELLSQKPEFTDLFVRIGRLGRSLGVHLLLATQRLEEGRLRGLDSHLSYRVGLRTFTAAESRTVLGTADAHQLPSVPGVGFLRSDPSTLTRFTASYVSGPAARPGPSRRRPDQAVGVLPFTLAPVAQPRTPVGQGDDVDPLDEPTRVRPSRLTVMEAVTSVMGGHGQRARRIWLPPLDVPATLDTLLPDLTVSRDHGLHSPALRAAGGLRVPIGSVDLPYEQRREDLVLDLRGARGHIGIVGGPRSGKSTATRTVVGALALAHTPLEIQVYVLDFGGGAFAGWERLPHVAGVAARNQPDVIRRVVAEVTGIADAREAFFRRHGIDSIERYRQVRGAGGSDDGYGDVFLVVDGWGTLRAEFDQLDLELQDLVQRGLTFGVHLIATANRWSDFRSAVRDMLGTRVELRLGDPVESEMDRKLAALVPEERPGRGLTPSHHHLLTALPRVDGTPEPATIGEAVERFLDESAKAWLGPPGPKLRLLPELVPLSQLREGARPEDRRLRIGVDERALAPVALDIDAEPHLLAFGDRGSGKSALLRTYLREVMRTRSPDQAQIMVVDYRRALLGEVPDEYLVGYLTNAQFATDQAKTMADFMRRRIPGPDVTQEQLRTRSWWSGKELFVVADDYDLVVTSQGSPLQAFVDLLPLAGDIGLHVAVARRSGGAGRSLHEPVVQSLRDLGCIGLVLSGNPDEGALIDRVRPAPAIPGRGQLVTRGGRPGVIQVAWADPHP